jgi:uncharacterized membrane protein
VLVPSVPTPMAGALYILPPERVHPVDVPFTSALKVFSKWGAGAGEFCSGDAAIDLADYKTAGQLRRKMMEAEMLSHQKYVLLIRICGCRPHPDQ